LQGSNTNFSSDRLYVMATHLEFGEELKKRIDPLITGVGPIEATLSLTRELERRAAVGRIPRLVVSLGSAGSRRHDTGSIHQISQVGWRDMDASALGFEPGVTPFLDEPAHISLATLPLELPLATLSTGANVVSGLVYDVIDADLVDMETFALARVCKVYAVPLVGIRGVSDGKAPLGAIDDWMATLGILDNKLSEVVDLIENSAIRE
jgi:adenosylhomocysteine nucleosidase